MMVLRTRWVVLFVYGTWAILSREITCAVSQELTPAEVHAQRLIVKVTGQFPGQFEPVPTFGAGIIVGVETNQLYIVTARHVVVRGAEKPPLFQVEKAQNLQIKFYSRRDTLYQARVLQYDEKVDMAVLSVDGLNEHAIPIDILAFRRLGDANALKPGDKVYPIGHPAGNDWDHPGTPDRIDHLVGRDSIFSQSTLVKEGYYALKAEDHGRQPVSEGVPLRP